ncbi:hypothetical protein ACFQ78_36915 [Streptomyces sp. NPDC056519]|uniref:hypothetical protein n=1 Tax=Streptomyces sp. NPDC056519 TaxID=3345849 RepID=UPI0036A383A8
MRFTKSAGIALASATAAVGAMVSTVPAAAADQGGVRTENSSLTASDVNTNEIVRVFTVKNFTTMNLKVESFTDFKRHDGHSLWQKRPSLGSVVNYATEASWSARPYESAAGRTELKVVLSGTDRTTGAQVKFTVSLLPGIIASGISATSSDPAYEATGGGSFGKRSITLAHVI